VTTRKKPGAGGAGPPEDRAVYIISIAAELAGVHPQTLRMYERKGLLRPKRSVGNTRRYSERDIARLRLIQQLTQDRGVNLAGARMIMEMQAQMERMQAELERVRRELARTQQRAHSMGMLPLRSIPRFPWERSA